MPNAPNTTLFLHTDWNQIDLYKLYRAWPGTGDFNDYCLENFGASNFTSALLAEKRELQHMQRILMKKFKNRFKAKEDSNLVETPLETVNQQNSSDISVIDMYESALRPSSTCTTCQASKSTWSSASCLTIRSKQ